MKATKKPVTIECFKYDGDLKNTNGEFYVDRWAVEAFQSGVIYFKDGEMYIKTLEGDHHASVGDYIIRGVNGELYPCKPDIFEKTYDIVEGNSQVHEFVETKHDLLTTKYTKVLEEADYKYIDALRMETVEKVVDDFTRWRKCDPVTGAPSEEYFRLHTKNTLVNVKFNYLGEDVEVIKIARWDLNAKCWKFQCSEDPMNDPEYKCDYRVAGWRPIH